MVKFLCMAMAAFLVLCATPSNAENITFQWDANQEPDLAGYRLYQSDSPNGQVIGGESSPNFVVGTLAGTETITITTTPTSDITLYWILTAYDSGDLESGKSNEVSHYFNTLPPAPPETLQKTNVQAANVYINGDVHVAEVKVETLRIIREEN